MNQINLAIQVLPSSQKNNYDIIDKAIEYIKKSGLKSIVCPFETVIEGDYDKIMEIVKQVQLICFEAGADELIVNLKIQNNKFRDVTLEQKMEKYW